MLPPRSSAAPHLRPGLTLQCAGKGWGEPRFRSSAVGHALPALCIHLTDSSADAAGATSLRAAAAPAFWPFLWAATCEHVRYSFELVLSCPGEDEVSSHARKGWVAGRGFAQPHGSGTGSYVLPALCPQGINPSREVCVLGVCRPGSNLSN